MKNEDRKLIEAYLSEEGTSLDRAYRAEQAREAVKSLLRDYLELVAIYEKALKALKEIRDTV